jgi:HD-GYP domain-containing protein (c-di-GMP phosphodiesterase class II)
MSVHLVADSQGKLSELRGMLAPHFAVKSSLLGDKDIGHGSFDTVLIAVDLKAVENILALKEILCKFKSARKKIFVVEQKAHLLVFQAYALGATQVIPHPLLAQDLPSALADCDKPAVTSGEAAIGAQRTASAGAIELSSMFSAVMSGKPIDVAGAKHAAGKIADSIADDGLSSWLKTVRLHHEGTYQHCLLVMGVAVDFGLSLGLAQRDIDRLYSAAMFHDVGKAKIPLAVLDKPGKLDPEERALIETHPAAGYDVLKATPGISPEILDAVRHHHEFLDGSGYPDGLCAANISDLVRILTISDIFAALIEDRRYKPPMPRDKAYEIICGMRGKLEVPLVVAFKEVALSR